MPAADLRSLTEELRSAIASYTGCVSGAPPVTEIERALRDAGFTGIEVLIKEGSRQFINDWVPGKNAGDFVASANIQARKP